MAITFPSSPTTGDQLVAGSTTYTWDGAKWNGVSNAPSSAFDWQSYAGDPTGNVTTNSGGSALGSGDQCWDSTNNALYIWDGAAWNGVGGGWDGNQVAGQWPVGSIVALDRYIAGPSNQGGTFGTAYAISTTTWLASTSAPNTKIITYGTWRNIGPSASGDLYIRIA